MSLIVWLPLNGDSHNQGLKKYTETTNTLSYAINGKVTEKCADKGKLVYNKNPLGKVGTICFWLYPKSAAEGNNGKSNIIFGIDPANTGSRKWSLYLYSNQPSVVPHNTSLHSWGCQKDGSKDPNGDFTLTGVLKESVWNHVCVAHDLDYEYVYINGTLKYKKKWDSNGTFTFDVTTPIIWSNNNGSDNFRMCDFRIYDHCLTQSEVSEIAKGLMLHYSFENPYTESTVNLSNGTYLYQSTSGSDDIGNYFIQKSSNQWNAGLWLKDVKATGGNYYTWSLEVNPNADIYCRFDNNYKNTTYDGNDSGFDVVSKYSKQFIPKNTWTKIWLTIYTHPDSGSGYINHAFCPSMPSDISECKVYYRNSMVEKKNHMTPYTSSKREAGLIRDNSGMGNDGTQVYQRIEIPLTPKTQTTCSTLAKYGGVTNTYNSTNKTYTLNNFVTTDNAVCLLATMKYNNLYHYVDSVMSYEFDITLKDIVTVSGTTPQVRIQGPTIFKDDTFRWDSNPVSAIFFTPRLNNLKNGTYHVYIEKTIENVVSNIDYYELGMRFDGIKSGTFTVSNLHAYYQDLDTSKLTIADKSAVGTHSAYFNGKNYIDCGLVTPLEIDELTLSCWAYRDDWSTLPTGGAYGSALISSVNAGGFGFKLERCVQESIEKSINFIIMYKDAGYIEHAKSYGMAIDYTKLSSGWHLITGVATRNKATLYVDGEKVRECVHNLNKPIYNYDTGAKKRNNLLVGAECEVAAKPPTAVGVYIDDVRLYATALSSEDIKALYNVKTRIDNKSNLLCNQLVETKSENMMKPMDEINISNEMHKFASNGTFTCTDGIMKYTISSSTPSSSDPHSGFYFSNSTYDGALKDNLAYRTSFYVRISKAGTYVMGDERIGLITRTLEAGKWYKIVQEGLAIGKFANLIIYNCSRNLVAGDTIEARDIQIYRLYDNENYNPGPNIKGQYKTFEIDETFNEDVENSGATIVDKYGAEWLEVFYHNNKNGTIYFANEQEALHTNSQYKFSILDQLENFRGTDNKFEFLLEYPTDLPNQYLRWKQSDNPVETTDTSLELYEPTSFVNGYELIHTNWNDTDNQWSGLILTNKGYSILDGVIGTNWWYAIGSCQSYTELGVTGVPGPKQGTQGIVIPNDTHLYVRIDNLENKNEIFRQYKRQTKTKEIIEI